MIKRLHHLMFQLSAYPRGMGVEVAPSRRRSIERARQAHRGWHQALIEQLTGQVDLGLRPEDLCFDDRCACGHWLRGEGQQRFGQLGAFQAAVRHHQMVHFQASNVLSFQQAGQRQRARNLFKTGYADASRRLLAALDELEAQALGKSGKSPNPLSATQRHESTAPATASAPE